MKTLRFDHVWDAIADTPAEAANLKARAELMHQLIAILKGKDWKITDAAKRCGVTQPRLDELLHGQIAKFTLDDLVNIAANLGVQVNISLETTQSGESYANA